MIYAQAIMASGQLRAVGTPLSLKRKNGAGWRLAIRTAAGADAAAVTARVRTLAPDAAPSDLRRRGVVQFTLADRENMSEVFAALEDDIANGELGAAGARDFTLEQPKLEDVFMRVVRAAEEDEALSGPPAPAAATDDVEAPLATPLLDETPCDAASDELARCCFGLDRRAHAFLAWVLSICALVL